MSGSRTTEFRLPVIATVCLVVALPATFGQDMGDPDAEPADTGATLEESTLFSMSGGSSYLPSDEEAFGLPELLWPGFLTGMRVTSGFQEKFIEPLGNPLYFESPLIDTQLRLICLWHPFPKSSQLGGGRVNVGAAQIRAARTDRLALIATKDGYSDFSSGITPDGTGWNDFFDRTQVRVPR